MLKQVISSFALAAVIVSCAGPEAKLRTRSA